MPSRRAKGDRLLRVALAGHAKGDGHARVAKPFARQMVLHVPRGVCPEVQEEDDLWGTAQGNRKNTEGAVSAGRGGTCGRARDVRPRASLPQHPAKVQRGEHGGFLKGKSAIRIHREFLGKDRNFTGFHFWARGYCVSTVGLDEQVIREYIRNQEEEEKRQEQLPLGGLQPASRPK